MYNEDKKCKIHQQNDTLVTLSHPKATLICCGGLRTSRHEARARLAGGLRGGCKGSALTLSREIALKKAETQSIRESRAHA